MQPTSGNPDHKQMVDLSTFGARLDYALEAHGIDNAEFARRIHPETGQQTVGNWRRRERIGQPSHAAVRAILPFASVEWINDGVGDPPAAGEAGHSVLREPAGTYHLGPDPDTAAIPAFAHSLALGDGATAEEYAESHRLLFRKSSLRRKGLLGRQLEVYYGRGDSMEPRIRDGDALLIDRDDTDPVDGEVFVLESDTDHSALVKRLTKIDGRWFFESDNKADPKWRKPVPLDGRHQYRIVGRVRWIGSWEG